MNSPSAVDIAHAEVGQTAHAEVVVTVTVQVVNNR